MRKYRFKPSTTDSYSAVFYYTLYSLERGHYTKNQRADLVKVTQDIHRYELKT